MNDDEQPTPRRTRAQLKTLVLEAAADLVSQRGLGIIPMNITYQQVFQHLEATTGIRVTRASVHERIWQSQEDFQLDVVVHSQMAHSDLSGSTLDPALEVFEATEGQHPLDRMREMTRIAAALSLVGAEDETLYFAWVGMTMSLSRDETVDQSSLAVLSEATDRYYHDVDTRVGGLLQALGQLLGVRPKRGIFLADDEGWRLISRLGTSLSEGASVRNRFEAAPGELPDVVMRTGPDGEAQEWTAFAAGYWALLHTFLEIDPEAHPDLVA